MNVTFYDGEARRRWSLGFGVLLSVLSSVIVFSATFLLGLGGRGWQVAFLVQLCFAGVATIVSMMAAESLAWRLGRSARSTALSVTVVFGIALLAALFVLFSETSELIGHAF